MTHPFARPGPTGSIGSYANEYGEVLKAFRGNLRPKSIETVREIVPGAVTERYLKALFEAALSEVSDELDDIPSVTRIHALGKELRQAWPPEAAARIDAYSSDACVEC